MKTEEELLEYYKEEIESGEVKKEELILIYEALKEDFNFEDTVKFNDIVAQNMRNVYSVENYIYKYTPKFDHNFEELIRWELCGKREGGTEKERGEKIKRYITQLLYTKGFKDINY